MNHGSRILILVICPAPNVVTLRGRKAAKFWSLWSAFLLSPEGEKAIVAGNDPSSSDFTIFSCAIFVTEEEEDSQDSRKEPVDYTQYYL